MPIYEYQCDSCGHTLDALQKISDAPLKKCPNCGKSKLKRLLSAPMFLLKGTGWYETDFKTDKDRKRNLADRPDADADKKVDGAKAETAKGDAKSDGKADKKDEAAKADKPAEKAEKTESSAKAPTTTRRGGKTKPAKAQGKSSKAGKKTRR